MAIGTGIVLLLLGLILLTGVVNVDIPAVDDHKLGVLLAIVGALAIVLSLVVGTRRRSTVVERDVTTEPPTTTA